jgi:Protein of unknown function (DUF3662)/FHA domain
VVRNSFERRLERLVTGTFTKAFRSGVQPIEVGRRIARELEAAAQVTARGTIVPNQISVHVSDDDAARFAAFGTTLANELADVAREHALQYQYQFVGPVRVDIVTDKALKTGDFTVVATIAEGDGAWRAALRLPDGRRLALSTSPVRIGRLPDCEVQLSDPKCSRVHAEIRPAHTGFTLHDLKSTNGTLLNDTIVIEAPLADGDEIRIGASLMRYEES